MEENQERKATRCRIYMTEVTDVISMWSEHTKPKKRTKTQLALISQKCGLPHTTGYRQNWYGKTDKKTQVGKIMKTLWALCRSSQSGAKGEMSLPWFFQQQYTLPKRWWNNVCNTSRKRNTNLSIFYLAKLGFKFKRQEARVGGFLKSTMRWCNLST